MPYMVETVTWTAGQLWSGRKRGPGASGSNVVGDCGTLLDSKKEHWWPTYRGPRKQAFGVHPIEASEAGLTHRKYKDLKGYVQGVNCVAVGEIGLDHVLSRQYKCRDQEVEVFA